MFRDIQRIIVLLFIFILMVLLEAVHLAVVIAPIFLAFMGLSYVTLLIYTYYGNNPDLPILAVSLYLSIVLTSIWILWNQNIFLSRFVSVESSKRRSDVYNDFSDKQ